MGKYTGRRLSPTRDEIAQLACSLYESRCRHDGHQIDDWLRAEQELARYRVTTKYQLTHTTDGIVVASVKG